MTLRYVLLSKFCEDSGYSEKAVRRKIEDGVWIENQQYRRGPDGRIQIDIEGYERWVEGRPAQLNRSRRPSASSSPGGARAA